MLLNVCHHACNVACSSFLMYSTEFCASAVQIHPEGKDLASQTINPSLEAMQREEGQMETEKTRQTTGVRMLCRSEQTSERAACSSLHQSFMVLPPWQWREEKV